MKKSDRYNYVRVPRSDDEGNRTYDCGGNQVAFRHDYFITDQGPGIPQKWKAKVGEEQAEVIKNICFKEGDVYAQVH